MPKYKARRYVRTAVAREGGWLATFQDLRPARTALTFDFNRGATRRYVAYPGDGELHMALKIEGGAPMSAALFVQGDEDPA